MPRKFFYWIVLFFFLAGCHELPLKQLPNENEVLPTPSANLSTPFASLPDSGAFTGSLEVLTESNVQKMVPIARTGEGTFGNRIAVSPLGDLLVVATSGGVSLLDAATGERRSFLGFPSGVESLAFSPDGQQLAAVYRVPGQEVIASGELAGQPVYNAVIRLVDLSTGEIRFEHNLSEGDCGKYAAWDLAFSTDGKTLVFRDFYSQIGHTRTDNICLLSTADGSLVRTIPIELPWQSVSAALFTPDGQNLLISVMESDTEGSSSPTTRIRFYEKSTGLFVREIDGQGSVNDIALSPDGMMLALGDQAGARLLSVSDGSLLGHVGNHLREVFSVDFSPDGKLLALGSLDGTVSLWSVGGESELWQSTTWKSYTLQKAEDVVGEIWDVVFSPDGATLFALAPTHLEATSGCIHAFRVSDGFEMFRVYGYNTISHPGVSPDQSQVAFGGYEDGQVQVWSVTKNRLLYTLQGHTGLVTSVAYAPDGRQLASASLDGSVRIWNVEDGSPIDTLNASTAPVRVVRFSQDGTRLASIADDAELRVWNVQNWQLLKTLPTKADGWLANSITFTPDGQSVLLALGCRFYGSCLMDSMGDLRRVDLATGQVQTLIPSSVFTVTFSADQTAFAIEGAQSKQSGETNGGSYTAQRTYISPLGNGVLQGAAISPDGNLIFSGNGFGMHVWNAHSGEMLALCKGIAAPFGEMQVTPDQKLVLVASWDGLVSYWGVPQVP